MNRIRIVTVVGVLLCWITPLAGAAPTPQRIPIQGYVTNDAGVPLETGSVVIIIHDVPTGGSPIWFSAAEFEGAVSNGVFDIELGGGLPLALDAIRLAYMTVVVNGVQFLSEATGGRYAFYPGGGDHARPDLESRLDDLETAFYGDKATPQRTDAQPAGAKFGSPAPGTRLDLGLLGLGRFAGDAGGIAVSAGMLLQPVGVFASGGLVLKLGPQHIPRPDDTTAIEGEPPPAVTSLRGCRPNPFNPRTSIHFDLSVEAAVRIEIHDLAGRTVRRLVPGRVLPAGRHDAVWNGRDDVGRMLAAGAYLVRFQAGEVTQTQSVTLLK